jgi:hypothetical protein
VRRWAKAGGYASLHLGGGVGGRADSLFHFKAGFGAGRTPFHTWRIVCDPAVYDALCAPVAPAQDSRQRIVDDGTGFFPAYRAAPCTEVRA